LVGKEIAIIDNIIVYLIFLIMVESALIMVGQLL